MSKARILLVEDSEAQAEAAMEFLKQSGYEVYWASDGKSAIKEAVRRQVDVVLLDLLLPDLSGYEVCRWLKINPSTKMTPILMLTARGSVDDRVSGLEAGADDYLPKPYSEIELNARIYALLRTKALQDELKDKNEQLESLLKKVETLAVTDPLTGLFNRRHLEGIIEEELKSSRRYGSPLASLMVDIDHFKRINDRYGHQCGDSVLMEVACMLKSTLREVDTLARWGGEEFVALLPRCGRQEAEVTAHSLLRATSEHSFAGLPDLNVTVSIGVACVPDPGIRTAEDLLNTSDRAMYAAKERGRNNVVTA